MSIGWTILTILVIAFTFAGFMVKRDFDKDRNLKDKLESLKERIRRTDGIYCAAELARLEKLKQHIEWVIKARSQMHMRY